MRRAVISRRTVSRWQKWRRVVRFIGSLVTFPSPPDAAEKYIYRSSKTRCMHTVGESEIGRSRFSWGTSRAKVFHAAFPQRGVTRFENLTVERLALVSARKKMERKEEKGEEGKGRGGSETGVGGAEGTSSTRADEKFTSTITRALHFS